jgi:hypothetical protein
LLFGRLLGSPPTAQLSSVAGATTFEDFFDRLGDRNSNDADALLAWLLERYLVPAAFLNDGRWLHDYLRRRLDAARSAIDPIDAFVPTADMDRLAEAWISQAPKPEAAPFNWRVDDAELFEAMRDRDALLKSTSWRLTAPLRTVAGALTMVRQMMEEWVGTSASAFKALVAFFTRDLRTREKFRRPAGSRDSPRRTGAAT